MPIALPVIGDMLVSLSVCGRYRGGAGKPTHEWFAKQKSPIRLTSRYKSKGIVVGVWLAIETSSGHVHVDIGLPSDMDWLEGTVKYERIKHAEMKAQFEKLKGLALNVRSSGEFMVPAERLPKRGIVTTLLGLSTEASGVEMRVSGIELDVSYDQFRSIACRIQDESTCKVTVNVRSQLDVGNNYFQVFTDLAREGLDRFVFETSRAKDARSTKRKLKRPRGA